MREPHLVKKKKKKEEWVSLKGSGGIPDYFEVCQQQEQQTLKSKKKKSKKAAQLRRPAKALDKIRITEQSVDDKHKLVELNVLKKILHREELLVALRNVSKTSQAVQGLTDLSRLSIQVVEAIEKWWRISEEKRSFVYDQKNYLVKMVNDTAKLGLPIACIQAYARSRGFDPQVFTLERNPFLEAEPLGNVSAFKFTGLEAKFYAEPPHLWERRAQRASLVLLMEEDNSHQEKQNNLLDVSKDSKPKQQPQDSQEQMPVERVIEKQQGKKANAKAPREPTERGGRLPPLSRENVMELNKCAETKLQRMDAEIAVCEETVATLQTAIQQLEKSISAKLDMLPRVQRENKLVRLREVGELDAKVVEFQRKLKYREMDLNSKKLARDVLIQNRVDNLNRQIRQEIEQDRRSKAAQRLAEREEKQKELQEEKHRKPKASKHVKNKTRMVIANRIAHATVLDCISTAIDSTVLVLQRMAPTIQSQEEQTVIQEEQEPKKQEKIVEEQDPKEQEKIVEEQEQNFAEGGKEDNLDVIHSLATATVLSTLAISIARVIANEGSIANGSTGWKKRSQSEQLQEWVDGQLETALNEVQAEAHTKQFVAMWVDAQLSRGLALVQTNCESK